jgi:two-component system OmpR family sensor kinase
VDLCRVVADAVEATQVTDGHRPVTVETEGAVVVLGDAARLRQIVDNLLHNAVVHTPAGTAVRVSVGREGPTAVVRVADDGPGLDSEQAARVFDRFYRGSEARTGEGTGLGLSIVAALAAAHGGRASVNAVPGAGAVFTVEIPAAEPDVPTDRTKQATAPGTPAPGEGGPEGDREVPSATGGGGDERLAPSVRR